MGSTYEDTVLDFDLNLLHQTSNDTVVLSKIEKQRKAIKIAKKKTIATDILIRKYYAKKEYCNETEKALLASKEECKKICIDYKSALEKCTQLEQDAQLLKNRNQELEEKSASLETLQEASLSHINQLQQLVKDSETRLEANKIEDHLERANVKDIENKLSLLMKEKKILLEHICIFRDAAVGKKKLHGKGKWLVEKYKNCSYDTCDDTSSDDEPDAFEDVMSPPGFDEGLQINDKKVHSPTRQLSLNTKLNFINSSKEGKSILKKGDADLDSDCSNEVVSVDTGRGSSLAFSDKGLHSPDYYIGDSPLSTESVRNKEKAKLKDVSTSPITVHELVDTAASPIIFEHQDLEFGGVINIKCVDTATSPIVFEQQDLENDKFSSEKNDNGLIVDGTNIEAVNTATSPIVFEHKDLQGDTLRNKKTKNDGFVMTNIPKITIDKATSTMKINNSTDKATSPLKKHNKEIATSPIKSYTKTINNECYGCGKSVLEKECLELNNSDHLIDDNSSDCEIERILNSMQLKETLITPIPTSPARSRVSQRSRVSRVIVDELSQSASPEAANSLEGITLSQIINSQNKLLKEFADLKKFVIKGMNKENITHENNDTEIHQELNKPSHNATHVNNSFNLETHTRLLIDDSDTTQFGDSGSTAIDYQESLAHDNEINDHNRSFTSTTDNLISSTAENLVVDNTELVTCRAKSDSSHEEISPQNINREERRKRKKKAIKLSRLERLRVKMLPKGKIQRVQTPPLKRLRCKSVKPLPSHIKEVSDFDSSATLNDKRAYENAVKVMAELNSKPKSDAKEINKLQKQYPLDLTCDSTETSYVLVSPRQSPRKTDTSSSIKISETHDNVNPTNRNIGEVLRRRKSSNSFSDVSITTRSRSKLFKSDEISNKNEQSNTDKSPNKSKDCIILLERTSLEIQQTSLNSDDIQSTDEHNVPTTKLDETKENYNKFNGKIDTVHERRKPPKRVSLDQAEIHLDKRGIQNVSMSSPAEKLNTSQERMRRHKSKSFDKTEINSESADTFNNTLQEPRQLRTRKSSDKSETCSKPEENKQCHSQTLNESAVLQEVRHLRKRVSHEKIDIPCKRLLRSSGTQIVDSAGVSSLSTKSTNDLSKTSSEKKIENNVSTRTLRRTSERQVETTSSSLHISTEDNHKKVNYDDLDLFSDEPSPVSHSDETLHKGSHEKKNSKTDRTTPQNSVLCKMIQKYGVSTVKNNLPKMPETEIKNICNKLEEGIGLISKLHVNETKPAMQRLAEDLRVYKPKNFLAALMKYLKNPERKNELFNKMNILPAPSMTKAEQILLYIVPQLQQSWPEIDLFACIMSNIEYTLFKLNHTPDFGTIESMSHFYAVLCRYIKAKSKLRLFILDAMYCIQFKSIPLIKQCLDVWMHALPLGHMGIAKTPLVTCMVYLLHFYKCEDRGNRVMELRNILSRKYFFQITEWTDKKILEMFTSSIKEMNDKPIERKMLRIALIILAKRQGARWCQTNIVQNLLQPLIDEQGSSDRVKLFCVSMIGALLKPYPVEMKVHCEIAMNKLADILDKNPSQEMEEAVFASLIQMSKHNQNRVLKMLLAWIPKQLSPKLEEILKDFVRHKPVKVWKIVLSKISLS